MDIKILGIIGLSFLVILLFVASIPAQSTTFLIHKTTVDFNSSDSNAIADLNGLFLPLVGGRMTGPLVQEQDIIGVNSNAKISWAGDANFSGVSAVIAGATGGVGTYDTGAGTWYFTGLETYDARVYTYDVINGVTVYSSSSLHLPQIVIASGDDEERGHIDWSWTAASGSPDGYVLLQSKSGGAYNKYIIVAGATSIELNNTNQLTSGTPIVYPTFYFTNTIDLNGIINPIYSGITFYGEQVFKQGIDINAGSIKVDGAESIIISKTTASTIMGFEAGANKTTATSNTFFGYQAGYTTTTSTNNTLVGTSAGYSIGTGNFNTIIGSQAGSGLATTDTLCTLIGGGANAYDSGNTVLGYGSTVYTGYSGSILLGVSVVGTVSNALIIGSQPYPITNVYIGKGVQGATNNVTINASGGSGTNNAGGALILAGGKGTGNANVGQIQFQTSTKGSTGSTLQTLATRLTIDDTKITPILPIVTTKDFNGVSSIATFNWAGDGNFGGNLKVDGNYGAYGELWQSYSSLAQHFPALNTYIVIGNDWNKGDFYNTNPHADANRIDVNQSGMYLITVSGDFDIPVTAVIDFAIFKNGLFTTIFDKDIHVNRDVAAGANATLTLSGGKRLEKGDYIDLRAEQISGSLSTITMENLNLFIARIG